MIREDKELLLKDLYARLPYGIKFKADNEEYIREIHYIKDENVYIREYQNLPYWMDTIKPYLRPMSSMTEEEKEELQNAVKSNPINPFGKLTNKCDNLTLCCAYGSYLLLNYLYSKHFDVIGLIEKGLALEALEGMYD